MLGLNLLITKYSIYLPRIKTLHFYALPFYGRTFLRSGSISYNGYVAIFVDDFEIYLCHNYY